MLRRLALLFPILVLLFPRNGIADEISLAPVRDTTLYANDPAKSNGAGEHLFVGRTGIGSERRALIAFDVAKSLPPGTTITGARLELYLSRSHVGALSVALHRLQADFGEGTSDAIANEGQGALAASGDATWTHRIYNTVPWVEAGGDFAAQPSATTSVGEQGEVYTFDSSTLVSDVQGWLDDPASSYGWILVAAGDGPAKRFDARESRATGPRLVITYDPPPEPTGACCEPEGSCRIVLDPGASCSGGYQGEATTCTPVPCPPPVGACCQSDASGTCAVTEEDACEAQEGSWLGATTECLADLCPVVPEPFVDPLPIVEIAAPVEGSAGEQAHYRMTIVELEQKLHRDLPATRVWGFDDGTHGGRYPGPTIEAMSGEPVRVTWVNDLRDETGALRTEHFLPVDPCPHGAETNDPRTVIHLHGGHVPAEFDGHPELTLLPGQAAEYEYPNQQEAATLWYHDHALGITRLNVTMGLAGLYLLRSAEERALGLPTGPYEVPLVIQDRSFFADGRLRYPKDWQEHFFGNVAVVNGKVWPFMNVDRGLYRFRVLNGSGSRTYALSLSNGAVFRLIGTDGGLLERASAVSRLVVAPGERAEIVIDFGRYLEGTEIVLQNDAPAPYPNGGDAHPLSNIMKFVVDEKAGHTEDIPVNLREIDALAEADAVVTRDFTIERSADGCGGGVWKINGLGWNDITERPHLGTTEIWRFINRSGLMHPMHMHLVFFQVLDRQPFVLESGEVKPTGVASYLAPNERGWQDTVQVGPFEIVRVVARFEDYPGRFPYHCHILEHEDHEMMRQFETISVCGDGALARGIEECDDGNAADGDGCAADCTLEPARDAGAGDAASGLDAGARDAGAVARDATPDSGARRRTLRIGGGCGCFVTGAAGGPAGGSGRAFMLLASVALIASGRGRRLSGWWRCRKSRESGLAARVQPSTRNRDFRVRRRRHR